jgi:hypothetical protein
MYPAEPRPVIVDVTDVFPLAIMFDVVEISWDRDT